jgi:hypothetical protein
MFTKWFSEEYKKSEWFSRLSGLADSVPIRWIIDNRERIALILYILWLAGCGYWIYEFILIEAGPRNDWIVTTNDTREALIFIVFGIFGCIFLSFLAFFLLKLIFNLYREGICSLFPTQWHSLIKPISYMILLCFAFEFLDDIKVIGLTAYEQVSHLLDTSGQHDEVIERNISSWVDLIERLKK